MLHSLKWQYQELTPLEYPFEKLIFARVLHQEVVNKYVNQSPLVFHIFSQIKPLHTLQFCRPQQPRGLRRRSAAARLLRSWVRIPPGAGMSVCCECCVLSGRGLCDELITRPEESYRLCCVVVCDLETSRMRRPWPALGRSATENKQTPSSFILKYILILPFHLRRHCPVFQQDIRSNFHRLHACYIPFHPTFLGFLILIMSGKQCEL